MVSKGVFDVVWNAAERLNLFEEQDNAGNLPLHIAAGNNQAYICEEFLKDSKQSIIALRVKNNQGKTAAHVATIATRRRIGAELHYVQRYEKKKYRTHKVSTAANSDGDEDHDFGLPILKLFWTSSTEDSPHGLFEKDDDRKTCLHLAAENGKLI